MESIRFTDKAIQNLKPKENRYLVREMGRPGFGVRIFPSGVKSWVFVYTIDGRQRWMTLGAYPDMSLADAHAAHAQARQNFTNGNDPGAIKRLEKDGIRQAPTVADLIEEYLEKWARPRKKSWQEDQRMLYRNVLPEWGHRKAMDITRRDVRHLLESIVERGASIQSNRVFACIRKMFAFAVEREIVDNSPCSHIKPLAKETRKDRVLSQEEIRVSWHELNTAGMSPELKRALKLILITAQRPGEVLGARWTEIDGEWWTIPAERSKNGLAHRVYLTGMARALLGDRTGECVFPSPTKTGAPIEVNALGHALRRNISKWEVEYFTSHDLRRTAASHMTASGTSRLVVQKILNHAEPGVTAVYDRHSYDQEKERALTSWARRLEGFIGESSQEKVVALGNPAGSET